MNEKFCAYCRNWREDLGFKTIFHTGSGSRRSMCPKCQAMRDRPHSELVELARKSKLERQRKQ